MGRRTLPKTAMKTAVEERKVEDYIWALLEISRKEFSKAPEDKNFTNANVLRMLQMLITIQDSKPQETGDSLQERQRAEEEKRYLEDMNRLLKRQRSL